MSARDWLEQINAMSDAEFDGLEARVRLMAGYADRAHAGHDLDECRECFLAEFPTQASYTHRDDPRI